MALSKWAQNLIPTLTTKLGTLGIKPEAVPAFAAQVDLETAAGTSYNVRKRNNIAGIGGRDGYRVYPSLDAGIDDYVSLIGRKYPTVVAAGRTGDPNAVALALGKSPWAAHHYRLGASGDEKQGSSGKVGTEGQAIIQRLKGTTSMPPKALSRPAPPAPSRPDSPTKP